MKQGNKSVYAILGLLSFGSMSGYDIKKWINEGLRFFWNLSYGQIYPTLDELYENGLVTFTLEKSGKRPEKKIFSITGEGLKALRDWMVKPISFSDSNGNEMLLKLFFGAQVPAVNMIGHIDDYERHAQNMLKELYGIEQVIKAENREDNSRFFRLNTLYHGISRCEAQIRWCGMVRESLKSYKGE